MKIVTKKYIFELDELEKDLFVSHVDPKDDIYLYKGIGLAVTDHKLIVALMEHINETRKDMETLAETVLIYEQMVGIKFVEE